MLKNNKKTLKKSRNNNKKIIKRKNRNSSEMMNSIFIHKNVL